MEKKEWYILQVISGKEKMAALNLEVLRKSYLQDEEKEECIGQIRIPEEEIYKITDGKDGKKKKKIVKQRILPGYILIELSMPSDIVKAKRIYSDIVMCGGVGTFVGMKNGIPHPVEKEELEDIFERMGEGTKTKAVSQKTSIIIDFEIGEVLMVSEGPFKGLTGKVEHIDPEKRKVRLKIEIFGMPTPVELDLLQVEKTY